MAPPEGLQAQITLDLLDRVRCLERRLGQLEEENKNIYKLINDAGLTISSRKPLTTNTTESGSRGVSSTLTASHHDVQDLLKDGIINGKPSLTANASPKFNSDSFSLDEAAASHPKPMNIDQLAHHIETQRGQGDLRALNASTQSSHSKSVPSETVASPPKPSQQVLLPDTQQDAASLQEQVMREKRELATRRKREEEEKEEAEKRDRIRQKMEKLGLAALPVVRQRPTTTPLEPRKPPSYLPITTSALVLTVDHARSNAPQNFAASAPDQPQSTACLPEHRTNPLVAGLVNSTGYLIKAVDVAIKVFGKEGHAQAGQLQPPSPKDWQIRVRFQLDPTGAPTISLVGRISMRGPLLAFAEKMGHKVPFATFRVIFDVKDIWEASLELGGVADPMLLPPDLVKQLDDPNETPSSLRYLTFRWRKCQYVGFKDLHNMPKVSEGGLALLKALKLLGSCPSNGIQMWFLLSDQPKTVAAIECAFRAVSRAQDKMHKTYWGHRGDTWVRYLVDGRVVWQLQGIPKSPARIHPPASSSEKSPQERGDVSMSASIWS